jgi:hypothetical protein
MRSIGFSTGALCYSDFRGALRLLAGTSATAVELSALRQRELEPLLDALSHLSLGQYTHISVHLPSSIEPGFEEQMLDFLSRFPEEWLLITHPNVITMWERWAALERRLCIENMDKRKAVGQTAKDLRGIFERLPAATLCFDLGHAHQIDPTMGEAVLIIEEFRHRLRQLHISEVNSESKHDPISLESMSAFSVVAGLIPRDIPAILESRLSPPTESTIQAEMNLAADILASAITLELAGD